MILRLTVPLTVATLAALAAATPLRDGRPGARFGTTIRARFTATTSPPDSPGVTTFLTSYFDEDRKREEGRSEDTPRTAGAHSAVITRCDPREIISIDLGEREYTLTQLPVSVDRSTARRAPVRRPQTPNLLIETTTIDTGERKPLFGREARHVITTERRIPLEPAVAEAAETVTDGWYIDLDTRLSCERASTAGRAYLVDVTSGSPPPVISFRDIGQRETGYDVASTRTITSHATLPDGTAHDFVARHRHEVTAITSGRLDPSLFEPPAGFLNVTPGSWGYYWKAGKQWLLRTVQGFVG